jgi:hypothetical protein
MRKTVLIIGALVPAALGLLPVTANASPDGQSFGQAIADCAHMALGQRPDPPTATCTHDGHTHTFANFGAMVAHMREER